MNLDRSAYRRTKGASPCITASFTDDEWQELRAEADRLGRSVAYVLRLAWVMYRRHPEYTRVG
jgi:hypothetical protein